MDTPTVLLIDDESNLLFGLTVVLKRAGFGVYTADNGADGLATAKRVLPDVIVSDVMMPPPNGFELRRQLARDPALAEIPFIFLTARTSQSEKLLGLEAGADDYITKPFDRQELVARIKAVVRRHEIGRREGRADVAPKAYPPNGG